MVMARLALVCVTIEDQVILKSAHPRSCDVSCKAEASRRIMTDLNETIHQAHELCLRPFVAMSHT